MYLVSQASEKNITIIIFHDLEKAYNDSWLRLYPSVFVVSKL